jgi:glc operon protein GlcG
MYEKKMLGLAEANNIVNAIIDDVRKRNGSPLSIAVVDFTGDLVQFVRMDGASYNSAHMARAKAYSAAKLRHDTSAIHKWMDSVNAELLDWADPKLTTVGGAVCIVDKSGPTPVVVGAVGVGGWPKWQDDEESARTGIAAIS